MCRRPTVVSGLRDAYTYSDLIRNANTLAHVFRCSGLVARRPPWLPLGTSKPGPSADEEDIGAILSHLLATFVHMVGRPCQLGEVIGQTHASAPRTNPRMATA